jgi:hypothetical protein
MADRESWRAARHRCGQPTGSGFEGARSAAGKGGRFIDGSDQGQSQKTAGAASRFANVSRWSRDVGESSEICRIVRVCRLEGAGAQVRPHLDPNEEVKGLQSFSCRGECPRACIENIHFPLANRPVGRLRSLQFSRSRSARNGQGLRPSSRSALRIRDAVDSGGRGTDTSRNLEAEIPGSNRWTRNSCLRGTISLETFR